MLKDRYSPMSHVPNHPAFENHPLPWSVSYYTYAHWDLKSRPRIIDSNGSLVAEMPQNVCHPGFYDKQADELAHCIVKSVNGPHMTLHDICKQAEATMASWPEWKKNILGHSLEPMNKDPRPAVDNS